MALRIIRKSASSSHVELIRGHDHQEHIELSILCHFTQESQVEAILKSLEDSQWAAEHCEIIFLKNAAIETALRPLIPSLKNTAKLLTSKKEDAFASQLKTMVTEASGQYCLYVQDLWPDEQALKLVFKTLKTQPNVGVCAPIQMNGEHLRSAGLIWGEGKQSLNVSGKSVEYHMPQNHISHIFHEAPESWLRYFKFSLQVPAVAPQIFGLNKQVFQKIEWPEDFVNQLSADAVALHLGLALRALQYEVAVIPQSKVEVQNTEKTTVLKSEFLNHWQHSLTTITPKMVYLAMGFQEETPQIFKLKSQGDFELEIANYISKKQG